MLKKNEQTMADDKEFIQICVIFIKRLPLKGIYFSEHKVLLSITDGDSENSQNMSF